MGKIIIDAGPLVALLNEGDQYHAWSRNEISRLEPPVWTCAAVLSEVCYNLSNGKAGIARLRVLIAKKILLSDFVDHSDFSKVFMLMETYANVPMSFADSCLVRMVEENPGSALMTTDRDFTIYRQHRRRLIPLIAPF